MNCAALQVFTSRDQLVELLLGQGVPYFHVVRAFPIFIGVEELELLVGIKVLLELLLLSHLLFET